MDQVKLGKAAKLLAKAEATTFEYEATALAERAYRMVADVLNDIEDERRGSGVLQRRERRRLKDRRAGRRADRSVGAREDPTDAATNYRLRSGRPSPPSGGHPSGNIDLTA
jgi:hypothetical protein